MFCNIYCQTKSWCSNERYLEAIFYNSKYIAALEADVLTTDTIALRVDNFITTIDDLLQTTDTLGMFVKCGQVYI